MIQIISLGGALCLLLAYLFNNIRLVNNRRIAIYLNIIGGIILTYTAGIERQYGFILLEGFWSIISLYALYKSFTEIYNR